MFAQNLIRIPIAGDIIKFSIDELRHLKRAYDTPHKRTLFIFGRQSHKTTTMANIALAYTTSYPFFRTLVVYPSALQAKQFSEDRVKIPLTVSPQLRTMYPSTRQSVFHKRSILESSIVLRYAYLSAARLRGITGDLVILDEMQDILRDHIPVLEQVTFSSPFKLFRYAGTPLTEENVLNTYWEQYSTQCEWAVPCRRHGTPKTPGTWHWNILGAKNIGDHGTICDRCGHLIDPQDPRANWVAMQSAKGREDSITWEGYRIPQMVLPFMKQAINWKELLRKQHEYPVNRFFNEILALSYSTGAQPLIRGDIQSICNPEIRLADMETLVRKARGNLYAGLDWGGYGQNEDSYTVIVLGGYIPPDPTFKILWMYRYEGLESDPRVYMESICQILRKYGVQHIGSDWGKGEVQNNDLTREFGSGKIHQYHYYGLPQRTGKVVFNPALARYIVSRNEVMSDVITAIKNGKIQLPSWEDIGKTYAADFTSIRSEYNHARRVIQYTKTSGRPDDFFHATVYCLLASFFDRPREDILTHKTAEAESADMAAMEMYEREMERFDHFWPGRGW